jgi:hypothetical protein
VGTLYTSPVDVSASMTIKAVAYLAGLTNSSIITAVYTLPTPAVSAPVFTPAPGGITGPITVTLSNSTAGASIRYTLDGSAPSETAGFLYNGAFLVDGGTTVRAIGYAAGFTNSTISTGSYPLAALPPVITPAAGLYGSPMPITISTASAGASIYFTTDGSTPTTASTLYTGPFSIAANATVKAIATGAGYAGSTVTSQAYTLYTTLATWRAANSLPSDGSQDTATPAGDGVANLLKYAFNMGAVTSNNSSILAPDGYSGIPHHEVVGSDMLLTFVRQKDGGIIYTPQQSSTLGNDWITVPSQPTNLVDVNANWEVVTYALPMVDEELFARVKVHIPIPTSGTIPVLAADGHLGSTTLTNLDGSGTGISTTAGTVTFGNPSSTLTTMRNAIYIFQLPNLGMRPNPFTTASFSATLTANGNTFGSFGLDLYGLPARSATTILADDYFTGGNDTTGASKLVDNFVAWANDSTRPSTGLKTTSNVNLVNYLNAQYNSGAGIGQYVFLRLSADKIPANLKGGTMAMSEDAGADPKIDFTATGQ